MAEGKVTYHVSKREGSDGREWKVFIASSNKVIKLFPTQKEAEAYAKSLCAKRADGSNYIVHGLDGKMKKSK